MTKTLDELEEWARLLRKENHPLAETMEEIAEGWREDIDYLLKEKEHLKDALSFYATDEHPSGWVAIHALQFVETTVCRDRWVHFSRKRKGEQG